MTKKIIAFGGSNSVHSINKKFATFAANQVDGVEVRVLDLNDYEMPIYSIDREKADGIPQLALDFRAAFMAADGIIISFAEHNGAYPAAFKNIMDWISRIGGQMWGNKPMLLLSTSPGGRGGKTVLDIAVNKFQYMNRNTIAHFSLPLFHQNFSENEGILNEELRAGFEEQLEIFREAL